MGFQFNGTQANVTLSSALGLPTPSSNQTLIIASHTSAGGTETVYTCPAATTAYLMGYQRPDESSYLYVYNDAGALVGGSGTTNTVIDHISPYPLAEAAAGETFKGGAANGKTFRFFILEVV